MNSQLLLDGYKKIVRTIYSQKNYFERMKTLLINYSLPPIKFPRKISEDILALLRAIWRLGFLEKGKRFFWRLFFFVLKNYPKKFNFAITMAIYGFHFRKIVNAV